MAAPLGGFSEEESPELQIGHRLGLRWFTLRTAHHGGLTITTSTGEPVHIKCVCGSSVTGEDNNGMAWLKLHQQAIETPVLAGAVDEWQPGENVAVCNRDHRAVRPPVGYWTDSHPVPDRECGCGFWAYWALGQKRVQDPAVPAIVKGYGKTIQGSKGFRCSHAKIVAVYLKGASAHQQNVLESFYQADVYNDFDAMLEMNKAPEGQPELADDYYRHVVSFATGGLIPGSVAKLRADRKALWEELKTLADKAAHENRAFTRTEQCTWDALNKRMDDLDVAIKNARVPALPHSGNQTHTALMRGTCASCGGPVSGTRQYCVGCSGLSLPPTSTTSTVTYTGGPGIPGGGGGGGSFSVNQPTAPFPAAAAAAKDAFEKAAQAADAVGESMAGLMKYINEKYGPGGTKRTVGKGGSREY